MTTVEMLNKTIEEIEKADMFAMFFNKGQLQARLRVIKSIIASGADVSKDYSEEEIIKINKEAV